MITAFEARAKAIAIEQHIEKLVEALGVKIKEEAERGAFTTYFFPEAIGQGHSTFSHPTWHRVVAALKKHGYTITDGKVKVGGGFGILELLPLEK